MRPADMLLLGFGLDDVIPFLFVVVWVIIQVISFFRKAAQAMPQGRQAIRPVPPPADGAPGRPPEIDREIEELLRRTLGMEPAREPAPGPRPPKLPKQKPKPKPKKQTVESSAAAERGKRNDVSRHVEEAFAHDLAHESPSGMAIQAAAAGSAPAADLIASLRSPENVRRLMIVREILDVPSHRW